MVTSAAAVEFDDLLVGRRAELTRLADALEAAGRRGGEYALVGGVPGVGKSTLVRAFGAGVSAHGGLFGYGRFSDGARGPYSAVAEALGGLVAAMAATAPAEHDRWRADLARELYPAMAGALTALVPDLIGVLGAPTAPYVEDAADVRHRLWRVVARLLAATATYRPVVLTIDDLQWADQDSLLLLSELRATSIRNLLLVGTYRSGEFDPTSWDLSLARSPIELQPLSAEDLETLLDEACGRSPELPHVATEFHLRTRGNPLRVHQLLGRVRREGALTGLGADQGPTWDLRALTAIETSEDDDEFFARAIDQLRPAERTVLGALACIGGEFDLADAAAAVSRPPDEVARAVWSALDLRLLEAVDCRGRALDPLIDRDTRYRFSHDRVTEAARVGLSDEGRREVHLRIGRRLVEQGDDRLLEAARHLAVGGARGDDDERARFAEVQRRAAELARRQASFPLALDHSRAGLALLGDRGWLSHTELARQLQLGAAEAAYQVADTALLADLLDEAETRLREPADRARIALLRLRGQVTEHRLQDALTTGLSALDELGHSVPHQPGKARTAVALVRLKLTMRRWSDERLLGLPRCQDPCVSQIHLILDQLRNISYLARPELFPFIVGKEIELTLARGLVPSSPVAITSVGVLLVATGDRAGAQRLGEVGLRLTDRAEFRGARPRAQFLHLNFIRHWRRPLHEGLPKLREAYREALDGGEPEYAGLLAAVLIYQSVWAGRPLPEIDAVARSMIPEIQSQRVPALLCRSTQQLCLNLMGRVADPLLLAGESGYDEREVLPVARRENDVVTLSAAAITRLVLHYWCGDYAGAVRLAEETARYLVGMTGTTNMQVYHLFNALSRIRMAPRGKTTVRAVHRSLALLRRWAAAAPANYAAPCALLEGVWARARGDRGRAERHLDRAIALAEEHQLPLFAASAHEEAGALYAETGRASLSRIMVRSAHERWLNLGIVVCSDRLERGHPWLLVRDLIRPGSATPDPIAIHRLVQALSDAPTMHALAEALLGTVADTTGATRVLLFLGEGERLSVRALCQNGVVTVVDADAAEPVYDDSSVREAARTGRPALVPANPDHRTRGGPASVTLVVPVQVRGTTVGAVYVEHHEPVRAFGPGHQDTVITVCAHASAPLWNLEMEGRLLRADEHRRSLVDAQSRFIPHELLRILDLDDISRVRRGHRVERRMTVLISDIRGYTSLLEGMSVSEASDLAMGFLRAVELPIIASNGLLQDVRGDEILAVFDTVPDDAVRAGLAMLRSLRAHNRERFSRGSDELRVGIGVNTGVVGLGMVGGVNRMALTVIGDSVNLASRMEGATKRYGATLLISDQTYAELTHPDQFDIRRMERVMVVNRARPVTIYEVFDEDPTPLRVAKRAARGAFDEAFACFDLGEVVRARGAFQRCRALLPDDQVAPLHLAHCDAVIRGEEVPGEPASLSQK